MVHPDMRIGLYISNFLCVSTTIVIYSHLSESTPCKAPLYDIKFGRKRYAKDVSLFKRNIVLLNS